MLWNIYQQWCDFYNKTFVVKKLLFETISYQGENMTNCISIQYFLGRIDTYR